MPRRGRPKNEQQPQGSPAWMTTYGDMVTLLLTFFVFLFTFSTIEAKKFEAAVVSLQNAFGLPLAVEDVPLGPESDMGEISDNLMEDDLMAEDLRQLLEIERRLRAYISEEKMETLVELDREGRGLVLRFADTVLFDLGKADLKPEARAILDRLSTVIRNIPNHIRVEGHTDNLPISTGLFPSNWELSTRRATEVIRYFIEDHGFVPQRLSAAGYGEYRPLVPNDSEANRQRNRRVDVVIFRLSLSMNEPGYWGVLSRERE